MDITTVIVDDEKIYIPKTNVENGTNNGWNTISFDQKLMPTSFEWSTMRTNGSLWITQKIKAKTTAGRKAFTAPELGVMTDLASKTRRMALAIGTKRAKKTPKKTPKKTRTDSQTNLPTGSGADVETAWQIPETE